MHIIHRAFPRHRIWKAVTYINFMNPIVNQVGSLILPYPLVLLQCTAAEQQLAFH